MREPKPPSNEEPRLERLHDLDILDTLPERTYDDIVALAASICGVPISLVSLVDEERQWFKARHGLEATETPRGLSFCGHVVEHAERLVVTDAREDTRFADNPLVTHDPKVRFYAGAPLRTDDGLVLGSLCVIDHVPRSLTDAQIAMLESLSRLVMNQFALRLEVRRSEQLRREAAEAAQGRLLFERFFSISLDLLCIAGVDGYFKQLNPSWTRLLGYSMEELIGTPFLDFVHPDDRDASAAEAAKLGDGVHETVSFENRYRKRDGQYVWLLWTAKADPELGLLLAAARDITDRRQAEAELREAKDRAEAADRSKSQFLATMSHELRTPLNAIIGFSKILYKNKAGNLQDGDLRYLGRIRDNGGHLLGLINEVLDISKIEAGQMTYNDDACDVATVVDSVARLQESLAKERSLDLLVDIPDGLEAFRADQHRLRQVLINLVSNAAKFTENGSVTIRAVPREDTHQLAAIDVIDTGIGIDRDDLRKVFLPFKQVEGDTSRAYAGAGLGLAISRSLCEGMGMSLEVESKLGKGSTFRISVPRRLSENVPAVDVEIDTPDATARAEPTRAGRRVLVVDDNADARQLIADQLRDLSCEVRLARDGAECLRVARAWTPDLITLDLMMPNINGWQVLASLRADVRLKDIPVVVISTIAEEERGTLCSAVDVLRKPVNRDDLVRLLKSVDGKTRRALVIEDNADARVVLSEYLEAEGWKVVEAVNGREGLSALATYQPDVVFLDLMMPVMDGSEFLDQVRSTPAYRNIPVVVVTAQELGSDERAALLRKANTVLKKSGNLANDLQVVLNSEIVGSEETSGVLCSSS